MCFFLSHSSGIAEVVFCLFQFVECIFLARIENYLFLNCQIKAHRHFLNLHKQQCAMSDSQSVDSYFACPSYLQPWKIPSLEPFHNFLWFLAQIFIKQQQNHPQNHQKSPPHTKDPDQGTASPKQTTKQQKQNKRKGILSSFIISPSKKPVMF